MRSFYVLFVIIFVCPACSKSRPSHFQGGNPENNEATVSELRMSPMVQNAPPAVSAPHVNRQVANPAVDEAQKTLAQIIKNANVRFQVKELETSIQAVQRAVNQFGGYVAASSETRGDGLSVNFSIRVPAAQFEKLLDELLKQSVFLHTKNITSEDVTEQFVDIQARLKTKKEAEQRYTEILRLARTVKDVLTVEEQLRIVREEIEAQEGRLKYLRDQVRYSSIDMVMYKPVAYQAEPEIGFFSKLFEGIQRGWTALLGFTIVVASVWPCWLLLAGLFMAIRKWRKRSSIA